jgi:glycosyltransferase involved in cell wall biosynthesis
MKIVWVSHSGAARGGAELGLCEAAKELVSQGIAVHALLPWRGDLAERLESVGVNVDVKFFCSWVERGGTHRRLQRFAYNIKAARELAHHINSISPDVVVSNTLATPFGALAAAFARRPHVWYVHEFFSQPGHEIYFDFGNRVSLSIMKRLSNLIIVNSQAVFGEFQKWIPTDKLRLVYYGVEVPSSEPDRKHERHELNLIHAGRLSSGKRQEDAVRAVAILARRGLDVGLTLLGDEMPTYGPLLRKLCSDLRVEQRVQVVPFTDNPFNHIAAADCLVMCSKGEAFGRVTVEAMKLGKPVVGAESGGTAELIRHGDNGLLFRVGDAEDLAEKLEQLYHDRSLLNEIGVRAQKWANDNFNVEKYANELMQVFTEAIDMRTSAASLSHARSVS